MNKLSESREQAHSIQAKAVGGSPVSQVVTEVDDKALAAILEILQPGCKQFNLTLLAEESADGLRQQKPAFWCIDPKDGKLAFINKTPGYSVSIALVAQKWQTTE